MNSDKDTLHSWQRCCGAGRVLSYILYPLCYRLYLQHHHTDLFDTLDNCVGCPRDCHCPLRGVGQHVPRHLNLSTCGLETERERRSNPDAEPLSLQPAPAPMPRAPRELQLPCASGDVASPEGQKPCCCSYVSWTILGSARHTMPA